jgi:hypothetical protein
MKNIYALGLVGLYKKIFLIYPYNSFCLPGQPDFCIELNPLNNFGSPSCKDKLEIGLVVFHKKIF